MNILVFSWRDPKHPLAGGAEQVMHEHMKGWIVAGHAVTLFSSKNEKINDGEILDGIKMVRDGNQYLGVQIKGLFYYLKNKDNFDLVVDQFHGIPFFTPIYVKKPILAVLQEVAKEVWFKNPLTFPANILVGFLGYIFEPLIFLFYKNVKFMVGSNSAKEDLIKFGIKSQNVSIVPHGVLLPRHNLKHAEYNQKIITFLGTLSPDKGIEDAIRTFKILDSLDNCIFWVIGKAETNNYFKKIILEVGRLGLNNKIKFWGRVDNKKKFELLSKSFVLINPSVREGWGIVNIEANAVGTPVVSYPSQGLVDSVKNGLSGIITKNSSPEDLAVEIETLIVNKEKYKKLTLGAKKWANNFRWEKSRKLSLLLIDNISRS